MDKELSEAIEEGILNGFWKPICVFIITVTVFIGLLIITGYIQSYEQEKCIESGECPRLVAAPIPSGQINCYIHLINETDDIQISSFTAKDYQEASIKYEFMKPTLNRIINRSYPNTHLEISC